MSTARVLTPILLDWRSHEYHPGDAFRFMSGFAELADAAHAARDARPHVALALATLVRVEGSSYRQPGARLLVDAEHRVLAGAISGGCLEGDVAARAEHVCASGVATVLTYDLRDDLQTIWGFGSACDGVAHVVLEPLTNIAWLEDAAGIRHARDGGAVVTMASDTQPCGTIALFSGAVRSGSLCALTPAASVALLRQIEPLVAIAERNARPVLESVEVDGASVRCFVEPLIPTVSLFLIGAGRGAAAFAEIATTLGWDVTLIDHRQALLDALSLPIAVRTRCERADPGAQAVSRDARTAVALLSHTFETDVEWLSAVLPLPVGYVGVLGSRQRAAKIVETLIERGLPVTSAMRQMLYAPIGLDLGGETPESIALAAIAEIEAVMHGRSGGPLRELESPIHTRTESPR